MNKEVKQGIDIEPTPCKISPAYLAFKRIFDIVFSVLVFIVCIPIFLIIIICIKIDNPGPALFRHKRVGKDGKFIYLFKFRTMVNDAWNFEKYFTPEQMEEFNINFKLDDDPRITKIGNFLRKTSLDELPQLFNIISGDMSLIGPRPVTESELEKFGDKLSLFLSVTPGLTGWWACHGRSCLSYAERVVLETYYAENCSLALDIKCFFKTIICVLKGSGAK